MSERIYGRTASGREITDELIEELAAEAEAGCDVDAILARRLQIEEDPSDRE